MFLSIGDLNMNKIIIPLALAVLFLTTGCSYFSFPGLGQSPQTKAGIKTLEEIIRQGNPEDLDAFGRDISPAVKIVLDLGESAIPTLKKALYDPKAEIQRFASQALFFIGGEKARDTLKDAYDKTKNEFVHMCLCLSMASTGMPGDIDYLIKTLEPGNDKDNKAAATGAFLSLVVLKPERLFKDDTQMDSKWKELFLLSLDLASEDSPQMKTAGQEDNIILSLFRFGIPGTDQSPVFLEAGKEITWKLEKKAWSSFKDNNPEIYHSKEVPDLYYKPPYIEFETHINSAGTKALVRTGIIFGKKSGHGYSFILKNIKGQWKVFGMALTWIS